MITIRKNNLANLLKHYSEVVGERFLYQHLTPSCVARAEAYLAEYQLTKQRQEGNPFWYIPVRIVSYPAACTLSVELASLSEVNVIE